MDGMRDTPMTATCKRGNEKILRILIGVRSDVNKMDGMRRTPLTVACNSGNER